MENKDQKLIDKLVKENEEFKVLFREHQDYEKRLLELAERKPQTSDLHFQIETIKKKKLQGKDRMERILAKHR